MVLRGYGASGPWWQTFPRSICRGRRDGSVCPAQAMHKASAIEEESQMLRMTSTQRVQSASQQLALLSSE